MTLKDKSGRKEQAGSQRGGTLHMSVVWSCNEWDQLEEVIVGNPLHARFPTPDRSTQMAEFSDRSLAGIPRDGEDGVGFSNRGNVKLFEREALQPMWPRAHRASH